MLDFIRNDKMFGAVLVDITVPDHLRTYFEVFPPLFKNTNVKFEDIGNHMQEHCNKTEYKFTERRYLISSFFANKILLATPLLKYYLKIGLTVTRIYEIIEFQPRRCFQRFMESVTADRRAGIFSLFKF